MCPAAPSRAGEVSNELGSSRRDEVRARMVRNVWGQTHSDLGGGTQEGSNTHLAGVGPLGTEEKKGGHYVPWERVSSVWEGRKVTMSVTTRATVLSLCVSTGRGPSYFPHSTLSSQDWGKRQGREGCTGTKPLVAELAQRGPRPTVCLMMQI